MGWQNHQSAAFHADEGHHDVFMRGIGTGRTGLGAPFIAIGKRRLIAVVAISNQQLFIAHELLDGLYDSGIMDAPHTMQSLKFVQHGHIWLFIGLQQPFDFRIRIAVKHENLAEMGLGLAQQIKAVRAWLR